MDRDELEKRLMQDPDFNDPAIRQAVEHDPECARIVAEARAFEQKLEQAVSVRAPRDLGDRIIARQRAHGRRPELPWMLSTAAALALAVTLLVFQTLDRSAIERGQSPDEIWVHLASHWHHDGPQALAASRQSQTSTEELSTLLGGLGVELAPEILSRVRLGKACPTPDGRGAHLVLTTDDGPITLMIMPRTPAPMAPASATLESGLEAWLVNLDHGSMAVLAEPGRDAHALARALQNQVSVNESLSL